MLDKDLYEGMGYTAYDAQLHPDGMYNAVLTMVIKCDACGFTINYRHTYGKDWILCSSTKTGWRLMKHRAKCRD